VLAKPTLGGIALRRIETEAISKTIPGLERVVLWRWLIDLPRDIPIDRSASQARSKSTSSDCEFTCAWFTMISLGWLRRRVAKCSRRTIETAAARRARSAGKDGGRACHPACNFRLTVSR